MKKTRHNPERRAFRGRSYKKGGRRIASLKGRDRGDRGSEA